MIKYILKDSVKRIKIKSIYSSIRVLNVAIGLICFIIFLSIFWNEISFDKYNSKKDRIYRVILDNKERGEKSAFHPGVAKGLLADKFSQIEAIVRVLMIDHTIKFENIDPFRKKIVIADPGFFNLFEFKMIMGNGDELMKSPDKILISQREAKRIFKDENPIGKIMVLNNSKQFSVGGVFEDIPEYSHLKFDYLLSTEAKKTEPYLTDPNYHQTYFYLLLKDKDSKEDIASAFTEIITNAFRVDKNLYHFELQPLKDIYLHSANINQHSEIKTGNYQMILILPWIAFLIFAVVIGNYMILDIGNNISDIFRIGIHKNYGESKNILFVKFYLENLIYIISAALLSIILLYYFGDKISGLNFINFNSNELLSFKVISSLVILILAIPLIPSTYSLKLTNSVSLPDALKCKKSKIAEYKFAGNKYSINMRRLMLGFQFFTAICLIVASIVVEKQAKFIYNLDLGLELNDMIVVENFLTGSQTKEQRKNLFLQSAQNNPNIESFSSSGNVPLKSISNYTQVRFPYQSVDQDVDVGYLGVQFDFFKTIGATIIKGRNFDKSFSTDATSSVIINQELAKKLGDDIIGKKIIGFWEEKEKTVIGIVKNIYFGSTNKTPDPMAFVVNDFNYNNYLLIKIKKGSNQKVLSYLQDQWKSIDPVAPFNYYFLDDYYNFSNSKENTIKMILIISTMISLILSLVGIISVSFLASTSKIKEMGIRRVLGACKLDIFKIFIKEYSIPYIIASLLAVPFIYIVLNDWLTKYMNRTTIKLDSFIFALGMIAMIFIIISFISTFKITRKNLADTLRYE